ncbi:ribonuclease H-like domain-containing protein [Artemisia annua]|uniref:Ribonuclease H-like domain-containing protein n=1 Tax=Artemisia annua TaxID=35608 RepID=A0A2U1PNY9_ARTAN|nr:ribonuclease H-like domain-containing protein [Artemisia annua]
MFYCLSININGNLPVVTHSTETGGDMFEERGKPGIVLGYPEGTKGFKIFDVDKNKIIVSRHVRFVDNIFATESNKVLKCVEEPEIFEFPPWYYDVTPGGYWSESNEEINENGDVQEREGMENPTNNQRHTPVQTHDGPQPNTETTKSYSPVQGHDGPQPHGENLFQSNEETNNNGSQPSPNPTTICLQGKRGSDFGPNGLMAMK